MCQALYARRRSMSWRGNVVQQFQRTFLSCMRHSKMFLDFRSCCRNANAVSMEDLIRKNKSLIFRRKMIGESPSEMKWNEPDKYQYSISETTQFELINDVDDEYLYKPYIWIYHVYTTYICEPLFCCSINIFWIYRICTSIDNINYNNTWAVGF